MAESTSAIRIGMHARSEKIDMIKKIILMIVPVLLIGCASKHALQRQYENEDFGIEIIIPSNWKKISAEEAGQEDAYPESDLLRLGYFDPETEEKEGIFVVSLWGELETQQDRDDLNAGLSETTKFQWNNHPCYYQKISAETGTQCESYVIVKNDAVISFLIGYTDSYADSVTNIMGKIILK